MYITKQTDKKLSKLDKTSAFTIVELLVVIAIIAILAAITTISYTGIRQRAIISSLQSDLSNDSTQLKLYQIANDSYPTSNDCSTGPNPAPPKICLKTSPGNTYVNYVIDNGDPQTFCITEENSGINYRVTNNTGPVAGICNTITTNPSGLVATGGIGQIVLNWTAPSDNGGSTITGYKVYQGTSSGSETLLTTISNVLTYTSTGLSTGTTYYYKVTAVNAIGESGYSNEASDSTNPITYTLTTIAGTGGTVSSGGTYNTGSTPTITATPNTYYSFSSWSGSTGCSGIASHVITMDANKSCTANFAPIPVSVPAAPTVAANTAGVTTTWSWNAASCSGNTARYQYRYTITPSGYDSGLVATAGTSVAFTTSTEGQTYTVQVQAQCYNAVTTSGWSGAGSANYSRPITQYTLTTVASTGGTVSSSGTYNAGSTPTITATPSDNYIFSSWSGSTGCSGTASHTITMDANKTCTANFTLGTNWLAIGTQVWAKANLNVGTKVTGVTTQTNNSILEKYCYNNADSNCTTDGGLYQWGEAVQYLNGASNTTSPSPAFTGNVQGICPAGSHIPSDNDWKILEAQLGMTYAQVEATGWRGTDQGTQLKIGGSSGLNIPLAGIRMTDGSFGDLWFTGYEWSSSGGSTKATVRGFGDATVYRVEHPKLYGFSVRCIGN